jgi:hypothetical protein
VVNKKDMRGDFGNALMKAVTKAKRRLTLSICGLGMLDETEISSIPDATPVQVDVETGEVEQPKLRDKIYVQDEPPAEKELPPPAINLEIALAVIGKSDNRKYGECTADELSKKKLGLRKLLGSDKPLTDDRREEAYYKLEAIRVIEKAVADHKHVYPQATAE